jgi:hypothetical protein
VSRKVLIDDDAAQYANLELRLKRLEQGLPENMHFVGAAGEPAFQNSWVNYDTSPGRSAFFYRDRGRVYLGGVIKTGASNTVAFTLPVGYRPLIGNVSFAVNSSGAAAQVSIDSSGNVTPINWTVSSVAAYCFLDSIDFRHA